MRSKPEWARTSAPTPTRGGMEDDAEGIDVRAIVEGGAVSRPEDIAEEGEVGTEEDQQSRPPLEA
jgi:hypothetical protein